ncbi:MAG: gamma-glutamyltransferase [Proteobacteria bacterium]|nr:gamma-glutamyltransferase [Pseudomonadota bacterium]
MIASAPLLRASLPLLAGLILAQPALARSPVPPPDYPRGPVYPRGMVSAADPRAAEAGAEILRAGGNATDAAIATMLALTVVEPQSSGIGGGGFFVEAGRDGAVDTIDGRETAPSAASEQWFMRDGKVMSFIDAVPGGTSVGVPGNIALAARAHKAHGRLPWARLFSPAIRLAQRGFVVTPRLFDMLKGSAGTGAFSAGGRKLFYGADGEPLTVGTRIVNPALAQTLSAIAAQGPKWFYSGSNRRGIVSAVTTASRNPAPMTEGDVGSYIAKDREPVCGNYRQYRICGMGPPSSGATTVFATLKQLERFDLTALGKDSPVAWHLIAESMRLAYADRARYAADADFVKVPVAGMTAPDYLAARSALISPDKTMASVSAGVPRGAEALALADPAPAPEHGTSHFVAIDRRGNAVSYTSTIESPFGSGLMTGGYFLNNELTDFDMDPVLDGRPVNNRVQGGKRPRSSMSPSLVFGPDGKLRLAVGAAGGATIPAQVIRAVIGVIDWKLSAQDALALPVLFAPGTSAVYVEKGSSLEAMIPALRALGHPEVTPRGLPLKANAIEVVDGKLAGAADPRSEGRAISE